MSFTIKTRTKTLLGHIHLGRKDGSLLLNFNTCIWNICVKDAFLCKIPSQKILLIALDLLTLSWQKAESGAGSFRSYVPLIFFCFLSYLTPSFMKAMSNKPLNLFLESILTLSWGTWAYIISHWEILILAKRKVLASVTTSSLDSQWITHVMNMFLLFLICKTEHLCSITALLFMDARFPWFFKRSRGLLSLGRGQLMGGQTTETRSTAPVGKRDRIQGQDTIA